MTQHDLEGKGLTARDAIRQGLKHENLGPDTSPKQLQKWIEWTYPAIELPEDEFVQLMEEVRREES